MSPVPRILLPIQDSRRQKADQTIFPRTKGFHDHDVIPEPLALWRETARLPDGRHACGICYDGEATPNGARIVTPASCKRTVGILFFVCVFARASESNYDPAAAFAPWDMGQPVNTYRSSNGLPGPAYWQNRVDYAIHADLDETGPTLSAGEVVTYTNNSPDALDVLWFQLDQNVYRDDSRGSRANGHERGGTSTGFVIDAVETNDAPAIALHTIENDTRLRVDLPEPLLPHATTTLRVRYHFTIPGEWGGRMGWGMAKTGRIYDMAQWYPRLCVYDDIRGWDTLPYLAQEFYLEYGNFDYWITVPAGFLVAGSGELLNGDEVLTAHERQRLEQARHSDATIMIHEPVPADSNRTSVRKSTTWHFRMENTRDVAFSASPMFFWDAARINLPGGKSSLAMSFYPAESAGPGRWARSTEFIKAAVERFSQRWFPYPWPAAVNVAGPASGMEYPGLVFDGIKDAGKDLFWISVHEIGHSWFPMIVGFDERRDAWMDEGFNTFIDVYESDDFNKGEFAPKRDAEYAPGGGNPIDEIVPILEDAQAPALLSRADTVIEKYRHPVTYFKSALGLILLREEILGPERFDKAFRRFIAAWAFKHPKPADFFRAMESEGGEDLSWWWRGWYAHNWTLDLGVDRIARDDKSGATTITVGSHDRLVMPVVLRVEFADGSHRDYRLPVESWIRQTAATIAIDPGHKVVRATIDPDHRLPDRDRTNNSLDASQ